MPPQQPCADGSSEERAAAACSDAERTREKESSGKRERKQVYVDGRRRRNRVWRPCRLPWVQERAALSRGDPVDARELAARKRLQARAAARLGPLGGDAP